MTEGFEENIDSENQDFLKFENKSAGQGFRSGLFGGLLAGLVFILLASEIREGYYEICLWKQSRNRQEDVLAEKEIRRTKSRLRLLERRLNNLIPRTPYMIINTHENRFLIKRGKKILHEGVCSTGSYTLLRTQDGEDTWLFKTPRGMFRVRNVLKNPLWKMPDWVFIEEGKPVPAPDAEERFEYGVLGDYAFDLGSGYLVHGTLYQRFLGLPVTHGCIRLGDHDLKMAHKYLQIGSKVFIY